MILWYCRCRDMVKYLLMFIKVIIRSVIILKKMFRKKFVIFIVYDFIFWLFWYIDIWNMMCKGWVKYVIFKLDMVKLNKSVLDGEWSEGVCYIVSNVKILLNVVVMLFSIWNDILKMSSFGFLWRILIRSLW